MEIELLPEIEPDFDIEVTGFEMGEIDVLIAGLDGEEKVFRAAPAAPGSYAERRNRRRVQAGGDQVDSGESIHPHEPDEPALGRQAMRPAVAGTLSRGGRAGPQSHDPRKRLKVRVVGKRKTLADRNGRRWRAMRDENATYICAIAL